MADCVCNPLRLLCSKDLSRSSTRSRIHPEACASYLLHGEQRGKDEGWRVQEAAGECDQGGDGATDQEGIADRPVCVRLSAWGGGSLCVWRDVQDSARGRAMEAGYQRHDLHVLQCVQGCISDSAPDVCRQRRVRVRSACDGHLARVWAGREGGGVYLRCCLPQGWDDGDRAGCSDDAPCCSYHGVEESVGGRAGVHREVQA
mmetsp:Transcript_35112/g.109723  ORF Transcript_35112/g.109723 Transcript_35112/m.109723 type:complete len:202 (+) Transcript_35112:460-1065(+)